MKTEPTGIKITAEEAAALTQSIGLSQTLGNPSMVIVHNMLLKLLGEKYKYDWLNVEINPITCDVLKRVEDNECDNCDEKINKEDIRIEE